MATKVTWDVDSFLARLNCLSACRGIRFSLYPKLSWNIKGNLHIKIQGCVLYQTTHVRLGYVLDGESYSLYAVFPNLGKGCRKTTYLRTEEHQTWVNRIFLPSIYEHCPFDVTQHFPRSWQEAADKVSTRKKESVWQTKTYDLNPHYTLPDLARIWQSVCHRTSFSEFSQFKGVFLVMDGKDLKLQFKSSVGVLDCC